jgi:serine/threonine protein kinase
MSTISRFCSRCRKNVQLEGDRCPDCGLRLRYEKEENDFLSGPFVPQDTIVILHPDDTLMDRFKIKSHLGNGRFGAVYLAEDILGSTEVALKVVEVGPLTDDIATLQLKRERSVYRKISDFGPTRHIIRVYDLQFVPWGGTGLLLLSMEYANGGSLRKWLLEHQENIDARRTIGLDFFKQACLGVQTIHEAGLVHLDLKPENLLIQDGVIKVADFGLARSVYQMSMTSPELIRDGMGTPPYMAPEQIMAARPKDVDHLADIYALGCILFELLDGEPPYAGTPREILDKHEKGIKPKLKGVDEDLASAVFRCLSTEPSDRYKNISDLLSAVDEKIKVSEEKVEGEIRGFQWYCVDPVFRSQLADQLIPDIVRIDRREDWDIPTKVVMERGCAWDFRLREGRVLVQSNTISLLASRSFDLLKAYFDRHKDTGQEEDAWHIIKLFCTDCDRGRARYELDKWHERSEFDLRPAILLAVGYGEMDSARRYLGEIENSAKKVSVWTDCAKMWSFVFNDDTEAKRCLRKAETTAENDSDWLGCAEGWKSLFDDDREASRCVREAERIDNYSSSLNTTKCCSCAKTWKFLFNDDREARKCLWEAEKSAKNSLDWSHCVEAWKLLFNDEREARRCLGEAENAVDVSFEWAICANTWSSVFDNNYEVQACLKKAEDTAESSSDWKNCAEEWISLLDDNSKGQACLRKAEETAESSSDWTECIETWKYLFDDDTEGRACLRKAEHLADSGYDWSICADAWKHFFGDGNEAKRCLREAEKRSVSSEDLRWCADGWGTLFNDDLKAMKCLRGAEERAKVFSDMFRIALEWKYHIKNDHEARRCLGKAEEMAGSSSQLCQCAVFWESDFQESHKAESCLRKAEEMAGSSYDWNNCAGAWKSIFNDTREAEKCLRKAEEKE